MTSRIKPKGVILSEFISEDKRVKARYKNDDDDDWITIAVCHTAKQATTLATQLNQVIGAIKTHG